MDFTQVAQDIKKDGFAVRRFEKEGHGKYRDCIVITKNSRIFFQRFNYGEAAGLIFQLQAKSVAPNGDIYWNYDKISHSARFEAPKVLTGYTGGSLLFDGQKPLWVCAASYKRIKQANLSKSWFW